MSDWIITLNGAVVERVGTRQEAERRIVELGNAQVQIVGGRPVIPAYRFYDAARHPEYLAEREA